MEELKNKDKNGISTKKKLGKTTYEVVVHFNENTIETMQVKSTITGEIGEISYSYGDMYLVDRPESRIVLSSNTI